MKKTTEILIRLQKQLGKRIYLELLPSGSGSVQYHKDASIVFVFLDGNQFYKQAMEILNTSEKTEA